MKEPIDKGFSILKKQTKPESNIVYTLPDGSTTIWLNEYVDALMQADRDRIVKTLLENANGDYQKVMLTPKLIAEIKGKK
jgi:hypothetical protein